MVTLLNFLAQILVHFSKTLEHQDHLVDLFSQCSYLKMIDDWSIEEIQSEFVFQSSETKKNPCTMNFKHKLAC